MYKFADWTDDIQHSMMRRLNRYFEGVENFISLAGGLPDPDLMPNVELAAAAQKALLEQYATSLQYGGNRQSLKEHIANFMQQRGVKCTADDLEVTVGGQQCMDLTTKVLLNPGDTFAVADLSYAGIRQATKSWRPNVLSIPIDPKTGLDLDALEQKLEDGAKPAFLYTVPAAHNPVGVTMQLAQRKRLMEIARKYQMLVLEDDAYGFLEYDGDQVPALASIDPEWAIYLGSFAKILSPGIRLGWVIAPKPILEKVGIAKQMATLSTSPLSQHIVDNYLTDNDFSALLMSLRKTYGQRRDVMVDAIAEHMPEGVTAQRPSGGMFVWVQLPQGVDGVEVMKKASQDHAVGVLPGAAFATDAVAEETYRSNLRLTFVRYGEETVADGVARLGRTLKEMI